MPIANTSGLSVGFRYSWSSVYSSSLGISDTTRSSWTGRHSVGGGGVYPRQKTVSRNRSRASLRTGVAVGQRHPNVVHPPLELRERTIVVDYEVGPRALELRRHLGGDHLHRFRLAQPAVFDESLESQRPMGVDENDTIEAVCHV